MSLFSGDRVPEAQTNLCSSQESDRFGHVSVDSGLMSPRSCSLRAFGASWERSRLKGKSTGWPKANSGGEGPLWCRTVSIPQTAHGPAHTDSCLCLRKRIWKLRSELGMNRLNVPLNFSHSAVWTMTGTGCRIGGFAACPSVSWNQGLTSHTYPWLRTWRQFLGAVHGMVSAPGSSKGLRRRARQGIGQRWSRPSKETWQGGREMNRGGIPWLEN